MNSHTTPKFGPQLVTFTPTPEDVERDHLIAEGVLAYQKLQQQVDAELFSATPDLETLGILLQQKNLVRERLAAHGVKVRA